MRERAYDDELQPPVRAEYHATVHDLPHDERPRERLQKQGADSLSNADLLAIILRTGTQRDNVMEMAGKLLAKYGGLGGLMSASFHQLSEEYGLGLAKAAQLKAALELGKRLSMLQHDQKYQIRSADDVANLVRMELMFLEHEDVRLPNTNTLGKLVVYCKIGIFGAETSSGGSSGGSSHVSEDREKYDARSSS